MHATQSNPEMEANRGVAALQRGDFSGARDAFDKVASAGAATPQLWLLLAQACDGLDDRDGAQAALDRVLEADGRNPFALLMKGDLYLRGGDDRAAMSFYRMGMRSAAGLTAFPGDLEQRLERARTAVAEAEGRFQAHLESELARVGVTTMPPRFVEALNIAAGSAQVYLQQPTSFYYPGLPQIAWYEREAFAWVAELEANTDAMRAEVEAVLSQDEGLVPYVEKPTDRASRGHSLLEDARWSAFHLWKDGELVADNARRCPLIMSLLERLPIPRIKHRSPAAMISVLQPGTHIEPHNGMLNTRLICHIPLVVPPGCRLRVGNETRAVEAGTAMIFDDSIEHEAWNDGTSVRAVLLFEVWRPELSEDERVALTAMYEAISEYPSG